MLKLKNKQLAISLLRPQGFTIVELLIVIVVIAILASISVVAYRGISDRANDTVVENDLAAITKTLELIKVNLGRYPRYSEEFTASNSFKFSKLAYDRSTHNAMYCINIDTDTYALGVRSKSGSSYMLVNGTTTKVCLLVQIQYALRRGRLVGVHPRFRILHFMVSNLQVHLQVLPTDGINFGPGPIRRLSGLTFCT